MKTLSIKKETGDRLNNFKRLANLKDLNKAVKQLDRTKREKENKIFKKQIRFDRVQNSKLTIISYLEGKYQGELVRNTVDEYIKNYEKEHGSLKNIANTILENKGSHELSKIVKRGKTCLEVANGLQHV